MVFKVIENDDNLNYFQEALSSDIRKGWRSYSKQTRGPQDSTIKRRPTAHDEGSETEIHTVQHSHGWHPSESS